mmetsp:Transcript_32227/g.74211  ORF Transcript_32227/g.74211 Transcript_32227/m.74211 type:complete len:103 (+) Transcript_32227:3358-3666(+)
MTDIYTIELACIFSDDMSRDASREERTNLPFVRGRGVGGLFSGDAPSENKASRDAGGNLFFTAGGIVQCAAVATSVAVAVMYKQEMIQWLLCLLSFVIRGNK